MFDEITALGREQMKKLIAVEEKLGYLLPANVQAEDGYIFMSFFDGLLECAGLLRSTLESAMVSLQTQDKEKLHANELNMIENAKAATDRLYWSAQKARSGGASVKSVKAAHGDLRMAIHVLNLW